MRRLVLVVLVLAGLAWADDDGNESRDPVASSGLRYEAGGPPTVGDPVRVSDLTVAHDETDFVIQTSLGSFALTRKYSSSLTWKGIWHQPSFFAPDPPAGGAWVDTKWWSSLDSYATIVHTDGHIGGEPGPPTAFVHVRDPSGDLTSSDDVGESPSLDYLNASGGARIELDGPRNSSGQLVGGVLGATEVTLIRPGAGRYRYGYDSQQVIEITSFHQRTTRRYRLSAVYPDRYAPDGGPGTPICTFTSSAATCFGGQVLSWVRGGAGAGATTHQVTSVSFGGEEVLRYRYAADHRLQEVDRLRPSAGAEVTRYDYGSHFSASSRVGTETRTLFEKVGGGVINGCLPPGQGYRTTYGVSSEATASGGFSYAPVYSPGEEWFQSSARVTSAAQTALGGETVTQTFSSTGGTTGTVSLSCEAGGSGCATVSNASANWWVSNWAEPADYRRRDYRGVYTVLTQNLTETSDLIRDTEITRVQAGATDEQGAGALSTTDYTWQYADATRTHQRLPETASQVSVLQTSGTTTTRWRYDLPTKQLRAVIKSGWTRDVSGAVTQKHVGTFTFDRHACTAGATADPHGRTLEVHGPCFVQGVTSVDCDGQGAVAVPVTKFEYYADNHQDATKRGRLWKKTVLVGGPTTAMCNSTATLTTEYLSYDARGNVLQEQDPNGTTTTRVFDGDCLMSETVAGGNRSATTSYFYHSTQGGRLSAKRLSSGQWEVYCWRLNSDASCRFGGTPADQLQWKARIRYSGASEPITFASDIQEKTVFTYTPRPGALPNAGGGLLSDRSATAG